ncbi:MAG: cation:proton antiporter, partial [Promethearchaeia archaeon]
MQDTALEKEVNLELIEVGNALVLFLAGLSVEVEPILKYWYAIICVGLAQLAVSTGLFAAIGYGSGLCVGAGTTIFFGVACSLSSKQVTLDFFSSTEHQSPNSMHGRLLSGLGLFQDAIALVGFALLQAFERTMVDPNVACVQAAVEGAENASTPAPTVAETGGGHSARRAELFRRAEHAAAECVAAA